MLKPTKVTDANSNDVMSRIWIHEVMRVFHDRLNTKDDQELFKKKVYEMVKMRFELGLTYQVSSRTVEKHVTRLMPVQVGTANQRLSNRFVLAKDLFEGTPIMFGNYLHIGVAREEREYAHISEDQILKLPKLMDDYQDECNHVNSTPIALVFFQVCVLPGEGRPRSAAKH